MARPKDKDVGESPSRVGARQVVRSDLGCASDADRLVPLANVEALARAIPGARLQVLRGAGHVFPVEREEETIAAIEGHLGAV